MFYTHIDQTALKTILHKLLNNASNRETVHPFGGWWGVSFALCVCMHACICAKSISYINVPLKFLSWGQIFDGENLPIRFPSNNDQSLYKEGSSRLKTYEDQMWLPIPSLSFEEHRPHLDGRECVSKGASSASDFSGDLAVEHIPCHLNHLKSPSHYHFTESTFVYVFFNGGGEFQNFTYHSPAFELFLSFLLTLIDVCLQWVESLWMYSTKLGESWISKLGERWGGHFCKRLEHWTSRLYHDLCKRTNRILLQSISWYFLYSSKGGT